MPANIVLTGSSGNLGTYLLNDLVASSHVDRIWCLNRSQDAGERQYDLLRERGLSASVPETVKFHKYDVASRRLGLEPSVYQDITENATHILHAAWPVDWNKSFSSFESSIRGVSNLIECCANSKHSPTLYFVSSVAAAGNWGAVPGSRQSVPEDEIDDWKVARLGYGQSKLVAERLLAEASRAKGVTTAICRVGQVAGPVEHGTAGSWPRQEWFPSLIASSAYLGVLPDSLGPAENIDWTPVDQVSSIVVQLLFSDQKAGTAVFHHITNPSSTEWRRIVPGVKAALEQHGANGGKSEPAKTIRLTGLVEWVEALEESARDESADISGNPAVKLLSFFQNLKDKSIHLPKARAATLEVKRTRLRSSKMQELDCVNQEWISLWMKQWDAK
ncbi:uncharacterized protein RHO25_007236 [Cercospora beticola]|uniref:Thioester reductase (TE) domain-containing protein n=1 Tax=Cercospora beticola TaxID=122368 RepID=A0ABZ0NSU8_CERBT|nr:hypothetical protein RHO25_007236 [Cercospora beticola]CAK1362502.1 unnamed protein product [Cercospora beticola]